MNICIVFSVDDDTLSRPDFSSSHETKHYGNCSKNSLWKPKKVYLYHKIQKIESDAVQYTVEDLQRWRKLRILVSLVGWS